MWPPTIQLNEGVITADRFEFASRRRDGVPIPPWVRRAGIKELISSSNPTRTFDTLLAAGWTNFQSRIPVYGLPPGVVIRVTQWLSDDGVNWEDKAASQWDTSKSLPAPGDYVSVGFEAKTPQPAKHVRTTLELVVGDNLDIDTECVSV